MKEILAQPWWVDRTLSTIALRRKHGSKPWLHTGILVPSLYHILSKSGSIAPWTWSPGPHCSWFPTVVSFLVLVHANFPLNIWMLCTFKYIFKDLMDHSHVFEISGGRILRVFASPSWCETTFIFQWIFIENYYVPSTGPGSWDTKTNSRNDQK